MHRPFSRLVYSTTRQAIYIFDSDWNRNTWILSRMALALLYGGMPTPLLTKLGPSLIFPKAQPDSQKLEQNYAEDSDSKMKPSRKPPRAFPSREKNGSLKTAQTQHWEAGELDRINRNVVGHLNKLAAGKGLDGSMEDGNLERSNWKVAEHWSALLQWTQLDLDLVEVRQVILAIDLL